MRGAAAKTLGWAAGSCRFQKLVGCSQKSGMQASVLFGRNRQDAAWVSAMEFNAVGNLKKKMEGKRLLGIPRNKLVLRAVCVS